MTSQTGDVMESFVSKAVSKALCRSDADVSNSVSKTKMLVTHIAKKVRIAAKMLVKPKQRLVIVRPHTEDY